MTLGATLRFIHVAAGFAGLALGPVLMLAGKRSSLHHRGGAIYFGLLSVTCVSALGIAVLAWERLWPFAVAAVGTWLFGCAGFVAARIRRTTSWRTLHAVGLVSSYCGLMMAFFVTNARAIPSVGTLSFGARLMPLMLVSTCVVIWVGVQVHRGRLPRDEAGGRTRG